MPNETLAEERARLKRETKALGKNLDRFDMPSMTASTKSIPSTKKIKKEKPVLLETMFGQVTEEEFDRRMKAYKKGIDEESYKGYLDKRFSQYDKKKKPKGEESVKKKKMNMGRQATMGGRQNLANEETNRPNFGKDTTNFQYRNAKPPGMARGGAMGGRQNLANEETNRPNFGKDTTNFQYRNAKPPGMSKGGKIRGYGMARGGKACKML